MPEKTDFYLIQFNKHNMNRRHIRQAVISLSLAVVLIVFWSLKLTGIGIAGEAFCGKEEHIHNEECGSCTKEEHIHIASCYSNINADLETSDDWNKALADIARGPTVKENTVLIAQSQLGYTESTLNFQVDAQGVRRGITRYGQWYGNPYGDWSAMFVSFCLHYAGAPPAPANAGPEAMRLEWETAGLYKAYGNTAAAVGNLVFLRGNDGKASSVAIITGVARTTITVIEGDVDNTVVQKQYTLSAANILGYGTVPEKNAVIILQPAPAAAKSCTVWFDGTDGGLGHLTGSPNTAYTGQQGSVIRLPEAWSSPSKYSYKLRGWYDVTNSRYYPAGGEMEVTGNAVLYADWVAATYDLGVFNAQVADTVSTNSFITTHMFDYNYLFNIHSAKAQVTVSNTGHSEAWSMVTSGNVAHGGQQTLDFIFIDNDSGGLLCMPNNRSSHNVYPGAGIVTSDIYSETLGELLFSTENAYNPATGSGVLGKTYLGTGDHLFQIMTNKDDEHYGYYYYDSHHNAASFNQSAGRFYVYEYLAATSDAIGSTYSDFLPLNSPYANANGKTVGTYNYAGVDGEYQGVTHYRYDSKYDSGNYNSANNVQTDYAYGMRSDIKFYLPNTPGTGGNKDLFGNDMQFQFSGDDDLWVLVDGVLVLDIGGIHGAENGEIDFTTGEVTVQGNRRTSLMDLGIGSGDHTLTVLYLERGSSMSNCTIYFNLAPRFGLELQKEDVLTQALLNGAKFTVYEDFECTVPAELWESEDAYNQDMADGVLDRFQSTFTVADGIAKLWGLGSGNTYYIKETGPPGAEGYTLAEGVIRLTIEKGIYANYQVDVVADADGNEPSKGFTVHGVKIDEETQTVYIVVTNAPETVVDTTTVQVIKKWEDTADHSNDYITAYLTVTDPDGTVRRIREITLSNENDWMYTWTNLPKYDYDTLTEVKYGIEESYESGYYSTVRKITQIVISKTQWAEALTFQNGETYILRTANGYLSTLDNRADTGYKWVDEGTAKSSPNALWTTTVSGGRVKFTNGIGQTITFYYNNGSPTDFYATTDPPNQQSRQEFSYNNRAGGLQIFYQQGRTYYYLTGSMNDSKKFGYSTNANRSLIFTPLRRVTQTDIRDVEDWAYQITNTPLAPSNETSLAVKKQWVVPEGYDSSFYQEFAVTVKLFANGVDTGRSVTLTLKNNWTGHFQGLPYTDKNGSVIRYTVEEVWKKDRWLTDYGEIHTSGSSPPTYSVTITNTYITGGPMLPATGSAARLMYVLCGSCILLGTLVYGIGSRRKRERRMK
ncbi:MAG: Cna B-type domain-containing protein [Oscillospiraceae bacterium]|nr:Cna B-type domain-containing protein [Oscillospiraceae bacterium]